MIIIFILNYKLGFIFYKRYLKTDQNTNMVNNLHYVMSKKRK